MDPLRHTNQSYSCQQFCLWVCQLLNSLAQRIKEVACCCFRNKQRQPQSIPNTTSLRATSIRTTSSDLPITRTDSVAKDLLAPLPAGMRDLAKEVIDNFTLAKIVEIHHLDKNRLEYGTGRPKPDLNYPSWWETHERFLKLCEENREQVLAKLEVIRKELTTVEEWNAFNHICIGDQAIDFYCDPVSNIPMHPWARIFYMASKETVKGVYLRNGNRYEIQSSRLMEYAIRSCTFEDLKGNYFYFTPFNEKNGGFRGEFCMLSPEEQLKCFRAYPYETQGKILLDLLKEIRITENICRWSSTWGKDAYPHNKQITEEDINSTVMNALIVFNETIEKHPDKEKLLEVLHTEYKKDISDWKTRFLKPEDPKRFFYEVSVKFVLARHGKIIDADFNLNQDIPRPSKPRDLAAELVSNFTLDKIVEISKISAWSIEKGYTIRTTPTNYEKQFIMLCEARKEEILLKLEAIKKEITTVEQFNAFCLVCTGIKTVQGTDFSIIGKFDETAKDCAKRIYLAYPKRVEMQVEYREAAVKACTFEDLRDRNLTPKDGSFPLSGCLFLVPEEQLKCYREWSKVDVSVLIKIINSACDEYGRIDGQFYPSYDLKIQAAKNALTVLDEIIDQHPDRNKILKDLEEQSAFTVQHVNNAQNGLSYQRDLVSFLQKHPL